MVFDEGEQSSYTHNYTIAEIVHYANTMLLGYTITY